MINAITKPYVKVIFFCFSKSIKSIIAKAPKKYKFLCITHYYSQSSLTVRNQSQVSCSCKNGSLWKE